MPDLSSREEAGQRLVGYWLLFVALWIGGVAVVGALTRLTESGLSITEWNVVMGILPPLSTAEWQEAFVKYQAIPQYYQLNAGMSLAEFKAIFWWEWGHRLLARLSGVVFALPLFIFRLRNDLKREQFLALLGLLVLGALQGGVGWWMVKSGLSERVDVAPYRLMIHLGLACGLYLGVIFIARGCFSRPELTLEQGVRSHQRRAILLLGAIFIQILLGALVAGNNAGLIYNTFPDMNGELVPAGAYEAGWRSLFESVAAVQFHHRLMAFAVLFLAIRHFIIMKRDQNSGQQMAMVIASMTFAQFVLGVMTLIAQVPIDLATFHQAVALLLLGFATWHAASFVRSRSSG